MPTVVDALVTTLELDASGFTKGAATAGEATTRLSTETQRAFAAVGKALIAMGDMQKQHTDATVRGASRENAALATVVDSYKRLRNEVLGLIGAFVVGRSIGGFVDAVTHSDDALGRLSKRIGMSVGDLGALEGAAKRAGGTAEGIAGSIEGLGARLERIKLTGEGASDLMVPLARLGVSPIDPKTGRFASVQDLLPQLNAAAVRQDKTDPLATNMFLSQLGFDAGTIALLRRPDYQQQVARERKWAPSEQDTANARAVLAQVDDMRNRVTAFGRKLLNDLTPTFVRLLQRFGDWLDQHLPTLQHFIDGYLQRFARWLQTFDWSGLERKGERFWKKAAEFFDKLANWEPPPWLVAVFRAAGIDISAKPSSGAGAPGTSAAPADPNDRTGRWAIPGQPYGTPAQGEVQNLRGADFEKMGQHDMAYLMSKGASAEDAAAIVGNLQQESSLNPTKPGGLWQLDNTPQNKDRWDGVTRQFGKTINHMTNDEQLDALLWDMQHGSRKGVWDQLQAAQGVDAKSAIVTQKFEQPADYYGSETRGRQEYARNWLDRYQRQPAAPAYPARTFEQMQRDAEMAQRGSDAAEAAAAEDTRKSQQFAEFLRQLGQAPRAPAGGATVDATAGMLPHPISFRSTAVPRLIPTAASRWHVAHSVTHNSHESHVGAIHVHTPAKDGARVARELQAALQTKGLAGQSDRGLA